MDDKGLLRTSVVAARAARTPEFRSRAGAALARHAGAATVGANHVAAFVATEDEPPTDLLLAALVAAGTHVLLPVVDAGSDLAWGVFTGAADLTLGRFGLRQPRADAAAAAAAATADVAFVPALAVDRRGHRLGRGGGYYDRWLATARPRRVLAVVYDDEVLAEVPAEAHDRSVDGALTPSGVITFTGG